MAILQDRRSGPVSGFVAFGSLHHFQEGLEREDRKLWSLRGRCSRGSDESGSSGTATLACAEIAQLRGAILLLEALPEPSPRSAFARVCLSLEGEADTAEKNLDGVRLANSLWTGSAGHHQRCRCAAPALRSLRLFPSGSAARWFAHLRSPPG